MRSRVMIENHDEMERGIQPSSATFNLFSGLILKCGAGTRDQFSAQPNCSRRSFIIVFDTVHQKIYGFTSYRFQWLRHGGKRNEVMRGDGQIIVPNHADVLRNMDVMPIKRGNKCHCNRVIGNTYRSRSTPALQKTVRQRFALHLIR